MKWINKIPVTEPMISAALNSVLCSFLAVINFRTPILGDFFLVLAAVHLGSVLYARLICRPFHTSEHIQKMHEKAFNNMVVVIEAENIKRDEA